MSKYNIVISEGCTAFYTKINDVHVEDMTKEQQEEFLNYLTLKIKEGILDNTIQLNSIIECFQYHDYESNGKMCEQCGDSVSKTYWEI